MAHWPKWVIDAHDRQYVDDLLTANYWDKTIAIKPRPKPKEPKRMTRGALEDHALRMGPQYRDVPAEAMAYLVGAEVVDDG